MYRAGSGDPWNPTQEEEQAWDEAEAVRLLRHSGDLVAIFEAMGPGYQTASYTTPA